MKRPPSRVEMLPAWWRRLADLSHWSEGERRALMDCAATLEAAIADDRSREALEGR